ncbi:MAG: tetratricopeptide repeat protein, partial [SAR324 cluster bacterium]|nr:tetratricopeptide repeat protein [SAR324 cluster bacterium]
EAPGPSTDNSTRLLLEGLLALQVGELQQASGAWETLLTQEQSTVPKDWLLLTLADANRRQERFQEAASNYGTLLRKFPKSQVLPQALYGLGDTFRQMGDTVRQQVIWKELQKAYPEHRLSQQIRRLQASGKTAGAANE